MIVDFKTPTKKLLVTLVVVPAVIAALIYMWWPLIVGLVGWFYIDHIWSGLPVFAYAISFGILFIWWLLFMDQNTPHLIEVVVDKVVNVIMAW